jgi:hypothetical protein
LIAFWIVLAVSLSMPLLSFTFWRSVLCVACSAFCGSSDFGSTPRFTIRSTSTFRTASSCASLSPVSVSSLAFLSNDREALVPLKS